MPVKHTHIGGQAVMEGVMMRGKLNWAVAVRRADGTIYVEEHDLRGTTSKFLKSPIIRGIWSFYETLKLAFQALNISAAQLGDTEEEGLSGKEIALSAVMGIALAIGLFVLLPAFATNLLGNFVRKSTFLWNVIDGVLRLVVFFIYITAVSAIKDIQRMFAYHGAEHKTIHAFERGIPLEPKAIQEYSTMHPRCGTSFLLLVMVVAILAFSIVPANIVPGVPTLVSRIISRVVLLPFIAGIAYEVMKWAADRTSNPVVRVMLWPGLQLQRMTTREPDDSMIEVAVAAVTPVIERERVPQEADAAVPDPEPALS